MASFELFFGSIIDLLTTPHYLFLMGIFVALGILLGALPGISVNMSLILALPLTYSMDTKTAMCVLLACYIGAMSGGLISAIMLNIPGTGSSITTTFDGHPMALQGKGGEALGIGILTSFLGGLISFILLVLLAPVIARFALKFGPWEYFAVGIFSLTMIITVSADNLIKGVLAALFGMCIAMTGPDPITMINRYNFGLTALNGGITTTALMCGMFAVPEFMKLAVSLDEKTAKIVQLNKLRGFGLTMIEYMSHWKNIIRSSIIGAYVGILPGIGGSSASLMSYLTAKNQSKHPENFGKGEIEGLIASETANNACIGGSLIPLLALGIPGSASAAVLLSALTLHGIQCGPLVFINNSDVIYLMFAICFVANCFMLVIERMMLNGYIRILTFSRRIIMIMVIMMCFVGAYCSRNNPTDLFVFVIGGTIGYFLQNAGFARAPIILGYILSGLVEQNLRRGMSISRGSFMMVFTKPIAVVFLILAAIVFINSIIKSLKAQKQVKLEV